jgi:hypothetical protein
MRRRALTLGVLLILIAIFILEQGPQVLAPAGEIPGLSMHYTKENVVIPPTLYNVPASNYSFAAEDLQSGVQLVGSLEVGGGGQVAFYVMNEGNFSLWRARQPASLVLAKPLVVFYNFTFSPTSSETYCFVFANQGNSPVQVIFSLNSVQDMVVLNPLLQYAGFELLLLGVVLTFLGLRGGRPKVEALKAKSEVKHAPSSGWKCKFCGAENVKEDRTFCDKCGRAQT